MAELDELARVLGDPVIDELPDLAQKLRRNLLLSASFVLIYVLGGITVKSANPLGIEISGLSETVIEISLFSLVFYNLTHFVWHCVDYVGVWRIHLTGTVLRFQTVGRLGSEDADYPNDPRQSNLYRWWQEKAARIGDLSEVAKKLEDTANQLRVSAEKYDPLSGGLSKEFFSESATSIRSDAAELKRRLERLQEAIDSKRPSASLERFDRWFANFKRSQLIRLFAVEIGLPCILGSVALTGVFIRLVWL